MAALPQLEAYFVHNIREAAETIADDELRAQVEGFVGQERRHAHVHRKYNDALTLRYPGLSDFEARLKQQLDRSRSQHSLAYRMAYTAGYEALTYQLACFIMEEREIWFHGADPRVLGMLCWHAAEEVEHKSVAFDVFSRLHGGYLLRVRGLVHALAKSLIDIRRLAEYMLGVDGLRSDPDSRRRLRGVRRALAFRLGPRFRHYCKPGYHPARHADPPLFDHWQQSHQAGVDLRELPLEALNTLYRAPVSNDVQPTYDATTRTA